jgi:hypothetical protein
VGQRLFSFNKEDFTMSNIGKLMNDVAKYAKPFEQAADAAEALGAAKGLMLLAKGDLKGAIAAFKEGASAAKAIMDLGKEALFPGLQMKPQSMSGNNQVGKPDQPSIGSASNSMGKGDKPGIEGALDDLINMATVVKKMLGAFKKHAMNQMPKSPLEALLTIPSKHSAPGPHTGPKPPGSHTGPKPIAGPVDTGSHTGPKPPGSHTGPKPIAGPVDTGSHTGPKPPGSHTGPKPIAGPVDTGSHTGPKPPGSHTGPKPIAGPVDTGPKPVAGPVAPSPNTGTATPSDAPKVPQPVSA